MQSRDVALHETEAASAEGRPAADDPSVLVGQVIAGRYRVDAVLGLGGMGAVLRCRHLALGRDAAVKLLHPDVASNAEIAARFEREAHSASRLDHPNCLRVLDFGNWQQPNGSAVKYLAMQLLEGEELAARIGEPLPQARAVEYARQIAAGLEHAHAHGIIHRDLKPENVIVTRDHDGADVLKLVDFGIAKIVAGEGAGATLTRAGFVFGTPRYMSPEQAAGGTVDVRTDLYSLGIILYELLDGHPPFRGDDLGLLLRAHIVDDPPTLSDRIAPQLRALVMHLLQKERVDRPGSATEVRIRLEEIAAYLALPLDVRPAQPTVAGLLSSHGRTPSGSRPVRLWLYVAGGLFAFAGAIALLRPRPEPQPAPPAADLRALLDRVIGKPAPAPAARPAPTLADVTAPLLVARAPSAALAEVDGALQVGHGDAALALLDPLLREFPDDPQVHLRRARVLAASGRGERALDAYLNALECDAQLVEQRPLVEEILTLARRPELHEAALPLLIGSLGEDGLALAVTFANAARPVLGYRERHRVLAAVRPGSAIADAVDRPLMQALDLWQADQAERPCTAFAEALAEIERSPTAYVVGTLHRVGVPTAETAPADDRERCLGLPARLMQVRAVVDAAHPIPETEWVVPPPYAPKKKKRRGLLRRMFGG